MILYTLFLVAFLVRLDSFEQIREPERHRVLIVGAGVSGISAAATLLEHNVTDIMVLEASDRIGGRINTTDFGGVMIEKGAEYVSGEQRNAVYEMIGSHNLLVSMRDALYGSENLIFTNTNGDKLNSSFVNNLLIESSDHLEAAFKENQNMSVPEYVNTKLEELFHENNVGKELAEAMRNYKVKELCIINGAANLSELGPSEDNEFPEGDPFLAWKPESGGYKKLFDFLMKDFPGSKEKLPIVNKIVFGKQVTQIKYGDNKAVEVQCADGSTYLADHVIVTVSLGVGPYSRNTRTPCSPCDTMLHCLRGNLPQLGWWPENVTSVIPLLSDREENDLKKNTVHGHWMVDAHGFLPILGNDRMFKIEFFGDSCRTMESLPEEQILEGVTEFMENTLGKSFNISKPEKILRTSWTTNPFTLGSYSFHSVDSDKQNLKNKELESPIIDHNKPVVLFAGEATHSHFYSTVHGALETGRREAKRIIDFYNDKQTHKLYVSYLFLR